METFITEIPQETIDRIKWIAEKEDLSEDLVIVSALIIGTKEIKRSIEEDE